MNYSDANGFDITQNQDTAPCRFPTLNRAVVKFVFIRPLAKVLFINLLDGLFGPSHKKK